jgi:hypothetical protein
MIMNLSKYIQPLLDKAKAYESQSTYLGHSDLDRDFEIRFSQSIGESVSLLENQVNRRNHRMLNDVNTFFPVVLDRVTHPHAEFKGMGKIERKICSCEVKSFDDSDLTVTHFISTQSRDRGGDSLDPDGMVIEGRPVVLMSHGFSPLYGQEPIAKPVEIRVGTHRGTKGVICKTQFFDGSHLNPPDNTGRRLYEKCKGQYLVNWSIGWIPVRWHDRRGPHGESWRDVERWLLLEYSPVGVGMNPEAMTFDDKQAFQSLQFKIMPTGRSSNRVSDPDQIKKIVTETVGEMIHEQFRKLRE